MKRSGRMRRLTPLPTSRHRLRARKQRRTAQDRERAAAERSARLIVHERSGGLCEVDGQARAADWAHRVAEGQGGPWCPSNGLHLCRDHHAWCHAHPAAARERGWLLRSTDDPLATPALLAVHGLVLLLPDGSIELYRRPPSAGHTARPR